jgi:hypothetical protein
MKPIETKPPVTYRSVLLQAAEAIRKHGHCAYAAEGPKGELCVMAALGQGRTDLQVTHPNIYLQALAAIQNQIGGDCPVTWNYDQNAESVIGMLERAALK